MTEFSPLSTSGYHPSSSPYFHSPDDLSAPPAAPFGSPTLAPSDDASALATLAPKPSEPPAPPPIVICPTEVDHINITLEKNQQCACKDCGKLFNSVWYLKQHAVKHSNDRPFKCRFCQKTYKFRSNLYQHKCPDRQKSMDQKGRRRKTLLMSPTAKRLETNQLLKSKIEANMSTEDLVSFQQQCATAVMSDTEENDLPITYGLVIQSLQEAVSYDDYSPNKPLEYGMDAQMPVNGLSESSCEESVGEEQCVQMHMMESVREQPLHAHEIESYVQKNKQKLYSCRKCRFLFPTEEALLRHTASHAGEDMPYKCNNCRQSFMKEKELRRHSEFHTTISPWRCVECSGIFRSSVALRRHRDQCRQCYVPPVQNDILVSAHAPLDPFSFIPSSTDFLVLPCLDDVCKKRSPDSGIESSPSHASPDSRKAADDIYDVFGKQRRREDDEDSGFRSRVNSVTQSGSPGSASFSSEGGSPRRKLSTAAECCGSEALSSTRNAIGGWGTGPSYGQQLLE